MKYSEQELKALVSKVIETMGEKSSCDGNIPVGISNRHIHLSREHVDILFGKGYQLTQLKELSQPGQFACKEQLTIIGPSMRAIEGVRVLGPERKASQVEISRTDSFVLKVKPPVRESGDIKGSAPITIVGPKGIVTLNEGCIIANRHIHMSEEEGLAFGVRDGEYVDVELCGERKSLFYDVQIRVHKDFRLEMHIDTDDANAAGVANGFKAKLIKK
ncbi:MAG: phosphate propanoyltransferase [Clostridia bacterium]|nr:phosphate propanoyltransferase [Clostridia bacterium]